MEASLKVLSVSENSLKDQNVSVIHLSFKLLIFVTWKVKNAIFSKKKFPFFLST